MNNSEDERDGLQNLKARLLRAAGEEAQTARELVAGIDPDGEVLWDQWERAFGSLKRHGYFVASEGRGKAAFGAKSYVLSEEGKKKLGLLEKKPRKTSKKGVRPGCGS